MRDQGLGEAIHAADRAGAAARHLAMAGAADAPKMAGPSVAPLASVTTAGEAAEPPDEVDAARARQYALLALLLSRAPDAQFLQRLAELPVDASPLGLAHAALAKAARLTDEERVGREYFDLFIGLGRGELLPYGSYYLTGFLHERPLARLRHDLAAIGIARAEGNPEPEDHAAILCEILSGVISGQFAAPAGTDRALFEKHMAPWLGRFFSDLERAQRAQFYRAVGMLGRVFTEIETQAFALSA